MGGAVETRSKTLRVNVPFYSDLLFIYSTRLRSSERWENEVDAFVTLKFVTVSVCLHLRFIFLCRWLVILWSRDVSEHRSCSGLVMFSLWRPLCLYATVFRYPQISRVTHSKDGPVSLCALHKNFKPHVTIQRRHSSHLVPDVRHEGFKTYHDIFIKRGDTVELEDGNFIRVVKVLNKKFDNKYWIVGWRFVRNGETHGLPRHDDPNEVYWVAHLAKHDPRPAKEQALEEVEDSQIRRKRTMKMVNTTYLGHRKETGATRGAPSDGALFCRWKHVICTRTPKRHRPLDAFTIPAAEITEASFQRLRIEECDDGHNNRIADEPLRRSWRGVTKKGGAGIDNKETISLLSAVEALSLDDNSENKRASAVYTFADVCCGAGGASRGAEMAGLHLCWALDHNAAACESYSLNFSEVQLHHKEIKDVVNMRGEGLEVDILHLSPPCQAFSPARTHPNVENDIVNIAANMELGNCLDVAKPRIATLEQTSGLMSGGYVGGRHHEYWVKVIEQFTSRGYSVAWKNMKLAELGLPQRRERLIMIASW